MYITFIILGLVAAKTTLFLVSYSDLSNKLRGITNYLWDIEMEEQI